MSTDVYVPGVCNIGPAEIRSRRNAGYAGLAITIILFITFYIAPVAPAWRLLIFLPGALAASGFLQARLHFCAHFGMRGLFNFSDDLNKQESVDQAEFRRKDQRRAISIIAGSALFGTVVALIAYFLPVGA